MEKEGCSTSLVSKPESGRRRMKISANAFDEQTALQLMNSAMIRALESWRGFQGKSFEVMPL